MMTAKQKILNWINENFKTDYISISDFPILPGGKIINDCNGESMFVYWDIMYEQVRFEFGDYNLRRRDNDAYNGNCYSTGMQN